MLSVVAQFRGVHPLNRFLLHSSLAVLLGSATGRAAQAPNPGEVLDILRTNLPDMTDAKLQLATVQGLVREFAPQVWLAGDSADVAPATNDGPALLKAEVFPGDVLYLRIGRVTAALAGEVEEAFTAVSATNAPTGLVVDLRYAAGTDFAAAAAAADLAVPREQLLLDWGTGRARSTGRSDLPNLPIAVLVNAQTEGAAEALAGVLRDAGVAVVIGANTAGRAMLTEEFPLSNGQRLCIARKGIRLGSGAELTSNGLTPDIAVSVEPAAEKAWWTDPFRDLTRPTESAGTSAAARAPRRRINEAELVRARREGTPPGTPAPAAVEEEVVMVRDPALARALDLLKALAVVKQWQAK